MDPWRPRFLAVWLRSGDNDRRPPAGRRGVSFGPEGLRFLAEFVMKKCLLVLLLAVPACATPNRTVTFAEAQIDPAEGSILVSWDQTDGFVGRNACVYGRVVNANRPRDRC